MNSVDEVRFLRSGSSIRTISSIASQLYRAPRLHGRFQAPSYPFAWRDTQHRALGGKTVIPEYVRAIDISPSTSVGVFPCHAHSPPHPPKVTTASRLAHPIRSVPV